MNSRHDGPKYKSLNTKPFWTAEMNDWFKSLEEILKDDEAGIKELADKFNEKFGGKTPKPIHIVYRKYRRARAPAKRILNPGGHSARARFRTHRA
jgi:hypothetical protein